MNTEFVVNPVAHTPLTVKEGDKVGLKISASAERFHTLVKGTVTAVGTENIEIEIYELCDWISKEKIGKSEIAEHKYWHYIGKTIPITQEHIYHGGVTA